MVQIHKTQHPSEQQTIEIMGPISNGALGPPCPATPELGISATLTTKFHFNPYVESANGEDVAYKVDNNAD